MKNHHEKRLKKKGDFSSDEERKNSKKKKRNSEKVEGTLRNTMDESILSKNSKSKTSHKVPKTDPVSLKIPRTENNKINQLEPQTPTIKISLSPRPSFLVSENNNNYFKTSSKTPTESLGKTAKISSDFIPVNVVDNPLQSPKTTQYVYKKH